MKWFGRSNDKKKEYIPIRFTVVEADSAPEDLPAQLPFSMQLLRPIPGADRSDYWLAKPDIPIQWDDKAINFLVVGTRFVGASLLSASERIAIGVAYVLDESLLHDPLLRFEKCAYVAVCMATREQ